MFAASAQIDGSTRNYPPGDGTPDKHLPELYYLSQDPAELHNLAADPQSAPIRRQFGGKARRDVTAADLGEKGQNAAGRRHQVGTARPEDPVESS